jgi:hypothetical protein
LGSAWGWSFLGVTASIERQEVAKVVDRHVAADLRRRFVQAIRQPVDGKPDRIAR